MKFIRVYLLKRDGTVLDIQMANFSPRVVLPVMKMNDIGSVELYELLVHDAHPVTWAAYLYERTE